MILVRIGFFNKHMIHKEIGSRHDAILQMFFLHIGIFVVQFQTPKSHRNHPFHVPTQERERIIFS